MSARPSLERWTIRDADRRFLSRRDCEFLKRGVGILACLVLLTAESQAGSLRHISDLLHRVERLGHVVQSRSKYARAHNLVGVFSLREMIPPNTMN